eukprot:Nk52_evm3s1671 gene=Nk52_evmTU3s1671
MLLLLSHTPVQGDKPAKGEKKDGTHGQGGEKGDEGREGLPSEFNIKIIKTQGQHPEGKKEGEQIEYDSNNGKDPKLVWNKTRKVYIAEKHDTKLTLQVTNLKENDPSLKRLSHLEWTKGGNVINIDINPPTTTETEENHDRNSPTLTNKDTIIKITPVKNH